MYDNLCIVGLGYIGLPTAGTFSNKGINVVGVDVKQKVIDDLKRCVLHIYEPDLKELIADSIKKEKLTFSTTPVEANVYILAVPTPFKEHHEADLSYVRAAAESIAPYLKAGSLVILESTSPVGTTEKIANWICANRKDLYYTTSDGHKSSETGVNEVFFAHCPERVLPGRILYEIVHNDRIVGGINQKSSELARDVYSEICQGEIVLTDSRTAEMSKLTENSFRDVNIAFANELSVICDKLDINVWELIKLANRHPRVNILNPGPGVGGHCIAVDPWFIVDSVPEEAKLIKQARVINDSKPQYVLDKIKDAVNNVDSAVIAVLGLSFKANVDDLRESPALKIAESLVSMGYKLQIVEPYIEELPVCLCSENAQLVSLDKALKDSNIILGLVDHKDFCCIPRSRFEGKCVIDTRGMWDEAKSV